MAFLRRRRQRREVARLAEEMAFAREQIAVMRETFTRGDDFDLRGLVNDVFAGKPVDSVQLLADHFDLTADEFYSGVNLDEQWDGQGRNGREERLIKDVQFLNMLDTADYDAGEPQMVKLHASMKAKVLLFAVAFDGLYGTDYSERLSEDPLQFGVHEFSGS